MLWCTGAGVSNVIASAYNAARLYCRNVLDILRNNSRLEGLYAMACSRACHFCLTYKRTTEFRRLCDIVRNHLSNLLKYKDQGGRDRTDLGCERAAACSSNRPEQGQRSSWQVIWRSLCARKEAAACSHRGSLGWLLRPAT